MYYLLDTILSMSDAETASSLSDSSVEDESVVEVKPAVHSKRVKPPKVVSVEESPKPKRGRKHEKPLEFESESVVPPSIDVEEHKVALKPVKVKTIGSRADVVYGLAKRTHGGLTLEDLFFDEKSQTYKSKKASSTAKQLAAERKAAKVDIVKSEVNRLEKMTKAAEEPVVQKKKPAAAVKPRVRKSNVA